MDKRNTTILEIMIGILLVLFVVITLAIVRYNHKKPVPNIEDISQEKAIIPDYSLVKQDSQIYTYEDEHYTSMFGIDVSEFQNDIDWKKVKKAGVEFVFIRIGRRGATTGNLYEDENFEVNYKGASDAGLKIGVYFFSQAITNNEAREEADWIVKHLKGKTIHFPIGYDCEEVILHNEISRMIFMDKQHLTEHADTFGKRLADYGYGTYIYTNQFWADTMYDLKQLETYPIWFAQYHVDKPSLQYPFEIWQYTDDGEIDGIDVPVDLNIMFIRKDSGE